MVLQCLPLHRVDEITGKVGEVYVEGMPVSVTHRINHLR